MQLPLRVQTTLGPWPAEPAPALAGVSSFGFGGTNAHVVLQEAPPSNSGIDNAACGERKSRNAAIAIRHTCYRCRHVARKPSDRLRESTRISSTRPESAASLHDICYSAGVRRSHHDYRLAVTGNSPEQLIEGLEAFLRGEARPGLSSRAQAFRSPAKTCLCVSGAGSQWFGMGRRLLEQEAVFREVVERCDRAMRPYGDWSLLAELTATDAAHSRLNEIDVTPTGPVCDSNGPGGSVALLGYRAAGGGRPQHGRSRGGLRRRCAESRRCRRVICHRSRLFKPTIGQGAMAAVELSIEEARRVLAGYEDRVSIAASNSPTSTVLSGDPAALAAILDQLQASRHLLPHGEGRFCLAQSSDGSVARRFVAGSGRAAAAAGIRPDLLDRDRHRRSADGLEFDALYWARNMREPVLFSAAVQRLVEDGHDIFLEISPHPILLSAIQQGFSHLRPGRRRAPFPAA